MEQPTAQEIQSQQGTRNDDIPPWMSYAGEFNQKLDSKLEKQIEEYAKRRHDVQDVSSQNKEEFHRRKEMSDEVSKQYQWVHPDEYKDEGPRIGRIKHSSTFINELRSLGVACWYLNHPQPGKIILLVQKESMSSEVGCWVQLGFMPEYSIMRFDDHGVPLDERLRGWRTCLLQLILKGIITEKQADKKFGVAQGPASGKYLSILQGFRNRSNGWD